MYAVTSAFLSAAKSSMQQYKIRGTISNSPTNISFDEDDILKGSVTLSGQAVDSSAFSLGGVFISTLAITFMDISVPRNLWVGRTITLEAGLLVSDSYVYIPVGQYIIHEASHDNILTVVKAYDSMSKFDGDTSDSPVTAAQTPYQAISRCCTRSGVTLATTQAAIEAMANGTLSLSADALNSAETYRDVLSWVASLLGAYATINRSGELEIRPFHDTVDDTVAPGARFSTTYGDEIFRYTEIDVTQGKETKRYAMTPNDAYALAMGEHPFLQGDNSETLARNILAAVQTVCYNSCKVSVPFGIMYDLGDVLQFPDGYGSATNKFCVLNYSWKYGSEYVIQSMPKPSRSSSRYDKANKALQAMIQANAIACMTPTSSSEDDILDGNNADVLMFAFEIKEGQGNWVSLHTMLNMSVETTVDDSGTEDEYGDCTVTVTYTMDDSYVDAQTQTYSDGDHILTLDMLFEALDVGIHILTVNLAVSGGNIT